MGQASKASSRLVDQSYVCVVLTAEGYFLGQTGRCNTNTKFAPAGSNACPNYGVFGSNAEFRARNELCDSL